MNDNEQVKPFPAQRVHIIIEENSDGIASVDISAEPEFDGKSMSYIQVVGVQAVKVIKHLLENPPKLKSSGERVDPKKRILRAVKPLGGKL